MGKAQPANMNTPSKTKPKQKKRVSFKWTRRPSPSGQREKFSLFSFGNIVMALGVVTGIVLTGALFSARFALMLSALVGLAGLIVYEMASRRRWENEVQDQFDRITADYDRLVREIARNRNDFAGLKQLLSTAGERALKAQDEAGEHSEQAMMKTLLDQLAHLTREPETQKKKVDIDFAVPTLDMTGQELSEEDIGARMTDTQVLQVLRAAVEQDGVDLFVQPIVSLPQRKMRFYEMFSRIRVADDVYLPAERYIKIAMQHDILPVVDNLLLLRGLQLIRDTADKRDNRAFFCNITSLTLNDPKFMGDLVEFVSRNRELAARLVFELGQRDLATMSPDVLPVLDGLSKLGCRFSMDQVRSLSFDYDHLEARHIRFIKVSARHLLSELKEEYGLQRLRRLKSEMDREGIDLIVERIEAERQLIELLDLDVDYGQGFLLGKPQLAQDIIK